MKTCTNCRRELSSALFQKDPTHKDGLRSWCKDCNKKYNPQRKEYFKGWYAKNKDHWNETRRLRRRLK